MSDSKRNIAQEEIEQHKKEYFEKGGTITVLPDLELKQWAPVARVYGTAEFN